MKSDFMFYFEYELLFDFFNDFLIIGISYFSVSLSYVISIPLSLDILRAFCDNDRAQIAILGPWKGT
jgi:hypothetical protein